MTDPTCDDCKDADYNIPFQIDELLWALNKSNGNSVGPDDVGYPLIKNLPMSAKITLLDIYNDIWASGSIPHQWKLSLVIPLPKNNPSSDSISSYRPISLLDCIGKVLDRMVNRRLVSLLENRSLLSSSQFAYKSGKGIEHYFANLEEIISEPFANKQHIDCVAIDISKAFDRAWRWQILDCLSRWGIGGNLAHYVESFLCDRTFRVITGGTLSSPQQQENGVPQGGVLSVTLFLISIETVINAIPDNVKTLVYADDILLIASDKSHRLARKKVQAAVDKIAQWSRFSGYQPSPTKCQHLHICQNRHRPGRSIQLGGTAIPSVHELKILGIVIDRRLTFLKHCQYIAKATTSHQNLFKMLGCGAHRSSRTTLLQIFNNWLLPKIFYGAELYTFGGARVAEKLKPIYHRGIRSISGAFITSPIVSLLCESGQMPLEIHLLQNITAKACRLIERRTSPNNAMVVRIKNEFCSTTNLPFPEILPLDQLAGRPWWRLKPKIDWSIKNQLRAKSNPTITVQVFREALAKSYYQHLAIYTDGSVQTDSVGYGVFCKNKSLSHRLPSQCSIFTAEAFAIVKALSSFLSSDMPNIIFTDSESVLRALEKGTSKHPLVQTIDAMLIQVQIQRFAGYLLMQV